MIFDLLLDAELLAVPTCVGAPRARPPLRLRDECADEVVRQRAADVVVALAADDVVACAESKAMQRRQTIDRVHSHAIDATLSLESRQLDGVDAHVHAKADSRVDAIDATRSCSTA